MRAEVRILADSEVSYIVGASGEVPLTADLGRFMQPASAVAVGPALSVVMYYFLPGRETGSGAGN